MKIKTVQEEARDTKNETDRDLRVLLERINYFH